MTLVMDVTPRLVAALGAAGVLAACTAPVRLATPAEVQQATAPSPAPAAAAPGTGPGGLAALQDELRQLVDRVLPSVVQIDGAGGGPASGVVMDAQGDVVTNDHVVGSAGSFTVTTSDGGSHPATLVRSFAANDLAVVRMAGASGLRPATFGDSGAVRVGDLALAIGGPAGSVGQGIVSGVGRSQSEGNGVDLTGLLQTTAPFGPGSSGGALVDIAGEVIGITTLGVTPSTSFAIPSSQVTGVTGANMPYLGVTTTAAGTGGAQVVAVVAGGPAGQAGVQTGWVITALDGRRVADSSSVSQVLSGHRPGDRVVLTARLPDGSTRTVTVTLGQRPATP